MISITLVQDKKNLKVVHLGNNTKRQRIAVVWINIVITTNTKVATYLY